MPTTSEYNCQLTFEGYFNLLQRQPGQTLLMYVNDYEESYRKLLQHKVALPAPVQGWHLLRRASLTKEQRQLIMLKAPSLEKQAVIEALYLILGQDYVNLEDGTMTGTSASANGLDELTLRMMSGIGRRNHGQMTLATMKMIGRSTTTKRSRPSMTMPSTMERIHGLQRTPTYETSPEHLEEFDTAFASYTDARKRFNDLKMSRGFLPVVALADQQQPRYTGLIVFDFIHLAERKRKRGKE